MIFIGLRLSQIVGNLKNKSFKIGDVVVLISDDSIKYTIRSLYGKDNTYAICSFYDKKKRKAHELSIPLIAVKKYNKLASSKDNNNHSPASMIM